MQTNQLKEATGTPIFEKVFSLVMTKIEMCFLFANLFCFFVNDGLI